MRYYFLLKEINKYVKLNIIIQKNNDAIKELEKYGVRFGSGDLVHGLSKENKNFVKTAEEIPLDKKLKEISLKNAELKSKRNPSSGFFDSIFAAHKLKK